MGLLKVGASASTQLEALAPTLSSLGGCTGMSSMTTVTLHNGQSSTADVDRKVSSGHCPF